MFKPPSVWFDCIFYADALLFVGLFVDMTDDYLNSLELLICLVLFVLSIIVPVEGE